MITITELTKRYGSGARQVVAVDRISFDVAPGTVTGFLGSNGAGKSTTLRILCGLADATSGSALIGGVPYRQLPNPGHTVGALLDASATHPGRTGTETLRLAAMSMGAGRDRVTELLDLVGLTRPEASRRVGTYSLGMRQRLALAGALLADPGILIFDEPVNGLDTEGILWMRDMLRSLAAQGRTVFVSSHLMDEMQRTADRVIIIDKGRLVRDVTLDELTAQAVDHQVRVRSGDDDRLRDVLAAASGQVRPLPDGMLVTGLAAERIGRLALEAAIPLIELHSEAATLEDAFLQITHAADRTATNRTEGKP